jgi:hypothetical protein
MNAEDIFSLSDTVFLLTNKSVCVQGLGVPCTIHIIQRLTFYYDQSDYFSTGGWTQSILKTLAFILNATATRN